MRAFLLYLLLASPAGAVWFAPHPDVLRAREVIVQVAHTPDPRQASDAAAACLELFPEDPVRLFRLYVAVAWGENGFKFQYDKEEFGPINVSPGEADAAAARLGKTIKTSHQRVANWRRFTRDRAYCVWVSVEHLANLIRLHRGDVHEALAHHRYGPNPTWREIYGYVPGISFRYGEAWGGLLPRRLTFSGAAK